MPFCFLRTAVNEMLSEPSGIDTEKEFENIVELGKMESYHSGQSWYSRDKF